MSYHVRINNQVISVNTLEELKKRSARWKRSRLTIEVAEEGSLEFLPIDTYLASTQPAPDTPDQPVTPSIDAASQGSDVHPDMFHQKSENTQEDIIRPVTAPTKQPSPRSIPPTPTPSAPISSTPTSSPPIPSPPTSSTFKISGWYIDKDAHKRLWGSLKPQHTGHSGPWFVSGDKLIPIAGFWITGTARIIDILLFIITLGIYGIFMCRNIVDGKQTVGQKFAGIRMVRRDDITLFPGYGQLTGLFFCMLLAFIPLAGIIMDIGIIAQAFSKRKQGLHHKMCGVVHIEEQHYGANRGVFPYIVASIVTIALAVVLYLYIYFNFSL